MRTAVIALRQALSEKTAAQILCFGGETIPDLLRTPEYARLCCQEAPATATRLWMHRHLHPWRVTAMNGQRAPRVEVIVSDGAAYRLAAPGSDTVTEQVRHLLRMTRLTHVNLRVYGFEHLRPPPSGVMTVTTTKRGRTQTFAGHILSPLGVRLMADEEAVDVTVELNRIVEACQDNDTSRGVLMEVLAHRSNLCTARHCRFCGGRKPGQSERTATAEERRA